MKTLKKLGAALLVGAMICSLAACTAKSAKKISKDDFKDILEKESYVTMDLGEDTEKKVTDSVLASTEDQKIIVSYYLFDETGSAKEYMNNSYSEMKELEKLNGFEGSVSKNGDAKITLKASYAEDGETDEVYTVAVRADNMIIAAMTSSIQDSDVKAVDDIINKLCY